MRLRLCQGIRPASKMSANEIARTICLCNGEVKWGSEGHSGSPVDVWIDPQCPDEGTAIGLYHTHPHGIAEPSEMDIIAMKKAGLPFLCIQDDNELNCYQVK